MAPGTPFAQVRIQPGTLYYWAKKKSCGVKVMQQQNNYPAAENYPGRARMGQNFEKKIEKISQLRKLSQRAGNTLFHILIHCETIPYPFTLPKTLS